MGFMVVIEWLNRNAGAINVIATLSLSLLTGCYVILTKRQVDSANRRDTDALSLSRFLVREYAWHLGERLQELHLDSGDLADLYSVRIWSEIDLERFLDLVEKSRQYRVGIAADAVEILRRLRRTFDDAKMHRELHWTDLQVGAWESSLTEAQNKLDLLVG